VLGHQFAQDFVLGLDLLLQELEPFLLLLDLTDGTFLRSKTGIPGRGGKLCNN
jgi:hypothetical protein